MLGLPLVAATRLNALGAVFSNPALRNAELAWGGFHLVEWAHLVAIAVVAYEAGGARAVGLVGFARMVPSALATPFVALVSDRFPRERILVVVHAVRAATLGAAAAVLLTGGGSAAVYALVVAAAVPLAAHRPCHLALAPLLARSPRELVAANVAVMTFESAATLAGPAIAGVLLEVTAPGVVFAVCAGVSCLSAVLVARVRTGMSPSERAPIRVREQLAEGAQAILASRRIRLVVGLFGVQTLVRGFTSVLIVVTSVQLIGLGDSGVGYLNAAFGAGGLVGATAGVALVGRSRLGRPFQAALVCWGLPIVLLGIWPGVAVALAMLALSGLGNSVLDIAGFTVMQETADGRLLGRIFGLFELVVIVTVGIGWLLAPALLAAVDTRHALLTVGAVLPVAALLFHRSLGRLDDGAERRADDVDLLRATPIFAPLPFVTLGRLASQLETLDVAAGTDVVRTGESGEHYYVVESGHLQVVATDGATRVLGRGDGFGEIALLLDVPRTATVTALEPVRLRAIGREVFLAALTSHALSLDEARRYASRRAPEEALLPVG